jgi:ubiquinone/menaquinone biosynthesis methyltransferases
MSKHNIENKESSVISAMFNNIAGKYDFLNHFLSFGIDKYWRRKAVKLLANQVLAKGQNKVLDLACGTGDSTIELSKCGFEVIGADIAEKMVEHAIAKSASIKNISIPPKFEIGNAESLSYQDNYFNAVTIFFGIRNFNKREQCLSEIYRVTKEGGVIVILEFAKPKNYLIRFFIIFILMRYCLLLVGWYLRIKKRMNIYLIL